MEKAEKVSIQEVEPLIKSILLNNDDLTEEGVCKALGYNEGYISQLRSRENKTGKPQVSQKFLNQLKSFALQNARYNTSFQSGNVISEPQVEYNRMGISGTTNTGKGVFVKALELTASYERIIQEKERLIKLMETQAAKTEKEKDRLYSIIEQNLTALLKISDRIETNLQEAKDDLDAIELSQRAEHSVMLDSLERHLEKKPGKLSKEVRNAKDAYLKQVKQAGKISNIDR